MILRRSFSSFFDLIESTSSIPKRRGFISEVLFLGKMLWKQSFELRRLLYYSRESYSNHLILCDRSPLEIRADRAGIATQGAKNLLAASGSEIL